MTPTTPDSILYCPSCVNATVDTSKLIGGGATCRVCKWHGTREDCLVRQFQHQFSSQEELLSTFRRDVQLLTAEFGAKPIGRLLRKWGFIKDPIDSDVLTRYVKAIARGIAAELVEEREAIETEVARVEEVGMGKVQR